MKRHKNMWSVWPEVCGHHVIKMTKYTPSVFTKMITTTLNLMGS